MWRQTWKLIQSHLGYVSVKDFRWIGNNVDFVPLGRGQVDPAIFKDIRADYRGDYSIHVEYVPQQALAESACVAEACRAVGMSERSAYALRARADAISFRNAWDIALDYAIRRLSDAVVSRAISGVAVPVFFQGEQIGERRYYDERLAMFLLRYRDPLRYGKWLDKQEHRGHGESDALELNDAKAAVREDAGLLADQISGRFAFRLRELAAKVLRIRGGEAKGGVVNFLNFRSFGAT